MKTNSRFLKFVVNLMSAPGMYNINRIEDFELIFTGYLNSLNESEYIELVELLKKFTLFVKNKYMVKNDFVWYRLIRLNSELDIDSVKEFIVLFSGFIEMGKTEIE